MIFTAAEDLRSVGTPYYMNNRVEFLDRTIYH